MLAELEAEGKLLFHAASALFARLPDFLHQLNDELGIQILRKAADIS